MDDKDFLYVMYMGGPDSIQSIEPFLYNLFTDRDIIDFGIGDYPQRLLAKLIAKRRSKKVSKDYEKMGGGSPQLPILNSLLRKVSTIYREKNGRELVCAVGMCYYHPFIKDSVKLINATSYGKIYVMTMYPQYSYTTSGNCFGRFFDAVSVTPPGSPYKIIPHWHLNSTYNQCIISNILKKIEEIGKKTNDVHILFSAHSLPYYTVEKGDIYTKQITEQVNYLVDKIKPASFSLSYQSKAGKMKWLEPSTQQEIERLIKEDYKNVIVCPISFVSDHIETLIEIDELYIPYARKNGLNCVRMDSLNDSDDFALAVIDIIED